MGSITKTGNGYCKSKDDKASNHCKMQLNVEYRMNGITFLLSEDRDFGWQNIEGDNYQGTRAENQIEITMEEAEDIARWILEAGKIHKKYS